MRSDIKIASCIITLVLFVIIDLLTLYIDFSNIGESNPFAVTFLIVIFISLFVLALLVVSSRKKYNSKMLK